MLDFSQFLEVLDVEVRLIHCSSAIPQLKVRVNPTGFTLTFNVARALVVWYS